VKSEEICCGRSMTGGAAGAGAAGGAPPTRCSALTKRNAIWSASRHVKRRARIGPSKHRIETKYGTPKRVNV
jgi:hypothetical protein